MVINESKWVKFVLLSRIMLCCVYAIFLHYFLKRDIILSNIRHYWYNFGTHYLSNLQITGLLYPPHSSHLYLHLFHYHHPQLHHQSLWSAQYISFYLHLLGLHLSVETIAILVNLSCSSSCCFFLGGILTSSQLRQGSSLGVCKNMWIQDLDGTPQTKTKTKEHQGCWVIDRAHWPYGSWGLPYEVLLDAKREFHCWTAENSPITRS